MFSRRLRGGLRCFNVLTRAIVFNVVFQSIKRMLLRHDPLTCDFLLEGLLLNLNLHLQSPTVLINVFGELAFSTNVKLNLV